MTLRVREHFRADLGVEHQQDRDVREDVRGVMDSLDITTPDEIITETKKKDNVIVLAPGMYGGFSLEKEDTLLRAVAAESTVVGPVTISSDVVVEGVSFQNQDPEHTGVLVKVGLEATVIFRNCIFNRTSSDQTSSLIEVVGPEPGDPGGGRALLLGCLFKGTLTSTTQVISNPTAPPANVRVVASYNRTGGSTTQVNLSSVFE